MNRKTHISLSLVVKINDRSNNILIESVEIRYQNTKKKKLA